VPDGEDGRQWIWVSFAPEFRLLIAAAVGPRTLGMAQEVVAITKARVAGIPRSSATASCAIWPRSSPPSMW
jgi:hypothetical protein